MEIENVLIYLAFSGSVSSYALIIGYALREIKFILWPDKSVSKDL